MDETALCLSGGGYRATLFHAGSTLRLTELGLVKNTPGEGVIGTVSSVSGGSITSALAALNMDTLGAGNTQPFIDAINHLTRHTLIDAETIAAGLIEGGVNAYVAGQIDTISLHNATLQALPHFPNHVINATNLLTTARWGFERQRMGDYRTGYVVSPTTRLSHAVSASAGYPPYLSPAILTLKPDDFDDGTGTDCTAAEYRNTIQLTDGGVYDNLGLEAVWKAHGTLLVADASAPTSPQDAVEYDWLNQSLRVSDISARQVSALRKRVLMAGFRSGQWQGAYWNIRDDISRFPASHTLPCPFEQTMALANTETDLSGKHAREQQRLMNWGYAACDAAVRSYLLPDANAPGGFPFPQAGVG